jgi:hypothetical protein
MGTTGKVGTGMDLTQFLDRDIEKIDIHSVNEMDGLIPMAVKRNVSKLLVLGIHQVAIN